MWLFRLAQYWCSPKSLCVFLHSLACCWYCGLLRMSSAAFFCKFWSKVMGIIKIMPFTAFVDAWITACFVLGRFQWLVEGILIWLLLAFHSINSAHLWQGLLLRRVDVLTLLNCPCNCLSSFRSCLTELMNYNVELMLLLIDAFLGLVRFQPTSGMSWRSMVLWEVIMWTNFCSIVISLSWILADWIDGSLCKAAQLVCIFCDEWANKANKSK